MRNLTLVTLALGLAVGCGDSMTGTDSGRPDSGPGDVDSGPGDVDSGPGDVDSGVDAGPGDVDSGPGDVDGGGPTLDCTTYCTRMMTNCTGANAMYGSMDFCMDTCDHMVEGMLSDMGGNTLGCRIYHAGAAAGDPATHCIHAGPGGDGACGGNCESFCQLATEICPSQYPAVPACTAQCGSYAESPDYSAATTSGNSFACRLYHLTAAASDSATHCPHTAMVSTTCM